MEWFTSVPKLIGSLPLMLPVEVPANLCGATPLALLSTPHQQLPMGSFMWGPMTITCMPLMPPVEVLVNLCGAIPLAMLSNPHQQLPMGWFTWALMMVSCMPLMLPDEVLAYGYVAILLTVSIPIRHQ